MNEKKFKARAEHAFGKVVLTSVALCGLFGAVGCGSSNSGNGGGGTTGPIPLAAGGAGDVFVIQTNSQGEGASILDFAADTGGSLTPKGTLILDPSLTVNSVATDGSGKIYVGGYTQSTETQLGQNFVNVYAAGATGSATPLQMIHTGIQPVVMTVDAAGHIYLAGGGDLEEIVDQNTAIFSITTSFDFPTGIAVDGSGNIYVSVYLSTTLGGAIQVFAAGSQGDVTPVRTITTDGVAAGVALDGSGNIYTPVDVLVEGASGNLSTTSSSLVEYAGGTTGSATPLKTITGSVTELAYASGVQVDAAGNLYLANTIMSGSGANFTEVPEVLAFAASVTGNAAPAVKLTSSSWIYDGSQIALH